MWIHLFDTGRPESWPDWCYWDLHVGLCWSECLIGLSWGNCLMRAHIGPIYVEVLCSEYDEPIDDPMQGDSANFL